MPKPLDDEVLQAQPEIEGLESPGERIERRNSDINRRLDESVEMLESMLEGEKSEELSHSDELLARRVLEGSGKHEPAFREEVMRGGDVIPSMEADNYRDFWTLANNYLNTEADSNCIYLMAGEDWTPAIQIDGNWTFLGLNYESESVNIGGEHIQLANHDISEELPFDEEYDIAVVKSPGAGNVDGELGELGVDRAYEALNDDGLLVTDQTYEGDFNLQESVEPSPISYIRKVSTEHGSAYNTDQLQILSKD